MGNTTVGSLVDWVVNNWSSLAISGAIIIFCIKVVRKMDTVDRTVSRTKELTEKEFPKISDKLETHDKKLDKLESVVERSEKAREEGQHRSFLIFKGVKAALEGLQEVGADGPTKEALVELEDYMMKHSVK